jgi:hypothetical protein
MVGTPRARLDWGWWALALAGVLNVTHIALRPFSQDNGQVGLAYSALLISPSIIALVLSIRAARNRYLARRTRWAWGFVAGSVALQALGVGVWMVPGLVDPNSFATVADLFFLAFSPVLLAGLLCFPLTRGGRRERARLMLDVLYLGASYRQVMPVRMVRSRWVPRSG